MSFVKDTKPDRAELWPCARSRQDRIAAGDAVFVGQDVPVCRNIGIFRPPSGDRYRFDWEQGVVGRTAGRDALTLPAPALPDCNWLGCDLDRHVAAVAVAGIRCFHLNFPCAP